MSLFSKQPIRCNACGAAYETDFQIGYPNGKHVCSQECFDEMRWRETLSMLGKEYRPKAAEASR